MELTKDLLEEYPFKNNYFQTKFGKIHYVDEGNSEKVFVLVHGNPTWSFYYRNLIKGLKDDYRVIAIDHLGCGLSDKPLDGYKYTLEQRIEDLNSLLSELKVKDYNLVVHDWGGAIGIGNAVRNPENVKSLTILNTAAYLSEHIPFSIWLCKIPVFGPFIVKYFNAFCFPATFMTTEKPLSKLIKKAYLFPYKGAKNRSAISEFVQDIPMSENHRSYQTLKKIDDSLSSLTCPKLILWGGKDFCFNDHFFNKWNSIYPDSKVTYYKNAGHYVLEDEPQKTLSEIKSFLRGPGECL